MTPEPDHLDQFIDFWRSLREPGEAIPARSRLNPTDVIDLLPNLFISELLAPDVLNVRLIGTGIALRASGNIGYNPKGKNYYDFLDDRDRAWFLSHFGTVMRHPAGMLMTLFEVRPDGFGQEVTGAAVPLRSDDENHTIAISYTRKTGITRMFRKTGRERPMDCYKRIEILDLDHGAPDVPMGPLSDAE